MNDERRGEGGGAAVAAVVIVVILGFLGLLVVGGVGSLFYVRSAQSARMMEMQARMEAERAQATMMEAQMRAKAAELNAEAATARAAIAPEGKAPEIAGPEILLEVSAAGEYQLAGKTLSFDELKDALLAEHIEKGPALVLSISPQPETRFRQIYQAMEAAESASIKKFKIRNTPVETETAPQP